MSGLKRLKKDKENNKEKTVKEKVFFDPLATKEAETIKETLAATHIAEEINSRMMRENFLHDFQRSPEDAFVIWGMMGDNFDYAKWIEKEFNALVEMVAKDTGADPAQIADKEKRTKEQDDLLLKAGAKRTLARIEAYFHSKFNDAIKTLEKVQGNYKDPKDIPEENFFPMPLKEQAALYFFALHSEIDQREQTPLTEEQKEEIKNIFARVDDFAQEYAKESDKQTLGYNIIQAFINKEYPKKKADTIKEEIKIKSESIIKVQNKPIAGYVKYPIDPINNTIWHTFFNGDKITVGGKAYIDYNINFEELEKDENIRITKHLEPLDKKIYNIASNLYEAGNEYTTVTQIYKAMGGKTVLTASQRENINNRLTKMDGARIHIDNPNEIKFHKRRARAKYDGSLLPFERVTIEINGAKVENAIHFLREPPLFTFAKRRGQVLSIKKEVYEIPLSHTQINDELSEYLLPVINAIKQLDIKPYLTFATIFEKCGITDKRYKLKAKERIGKILEHFKNTKYINEYEITKLGIKFPEFEILFNEQQKRKQKAKLERKAKQTKK